MPAHGPQNPHATAPSLLDPRATGGIHGGDGFTVQDKYLALLVPGWLQDSKFLRFQSERSEDIDVWFDGGRDHHQVKIEPLTRGAVRALVEEFKERNAKLVAEQRVRRYVIACPHLSTEIRGFVGKLAIYRTRHFEVADEDERQASLATLREMAVKVELNDVFDFIVAHVDFDQNFVGLDAETSAARDLIAVRLATLGKSADLAEGTALANALLRELAQNRKRSWSRAELMALLDRERRTHRDGPAKPAGDLVLIRHVTLKRVDFEPRREDNAALFGQRRVVRVELDGVAKMEPLDAAAIEELAHSLASPAGPYMGALDQPDAELLYYGFPHVPFGVLAGYIAQPHRRVALVEHDLDTCRFEWRPDATVSLSTARTTERSAAGTAAQVRVSVSAYVLDDVCAAVLPTADVGVDVSVEAAEVRRGVVTTEAQAREYSARLRRELDQRLSGNAGITSIHLFAAVPVSVAFRIGQVLANTGLPRCYVYNFDAAATPQYCWRLDLREAKRGARCAELLGRK